MYIADTKHIYIHLCILHSKISQCTHMHTPSPITLSEHTAQQTIDASLLHVCMYNSAIYMDSHYYTVFT